MYFNKSSPPSLLIPYLKSLVSNHPYFSAITHACITFAPRDNFPYPHSSLHYLHLVHQVWPSYPFPLSSIFDLFSFGLPLFFPLVRAQLPYTPFSPDRFNPFLLPPILDLYPLGLPLFALIVKALLPHTPFSHPLGLPLSPFSSHTPFQSRVRFTLRVLHEKDSNCPWRRMRFSRPGFPTSCIMQISQSNSNHRFCLVKTTSKELRCTKCDSADQGFLPHALCRLVNQIQTTAFVWWKDKCIITKCQISFRRPGFLSSCIMQISQSNSHHM